MSINSQLDTAWSKEVKIRAGYICEWCGCTHRQLHSHHMVGRKILATRWDARNGICLCVTCHKFGKHCVHEDPEYFRDWVLSSHRKDDYIYANSKKWEEFKVNNEGRRIMLKEKKAYIKESGEKY